MCVDVCVCLHFCCAVCHMLIGIRTYVGMTQVIHKFEDRSRAVSRVSYFNYAWPRTYIVTFSLDQLLQQFSIFRADLSLFSP